LINSDISVRHQIFKILFENEFNSVRIDYLLSQDALGENFSDSEIRFIHKVTYGIIRNKSKLDYYISKFYDGKFKKLLNKYKVILRIGVYQLFYMDSVPEYAAVNTTVDLCKRVDSSKSKLINAIMRKLSINNDIKNKDIKDIDIKYSHPKWLIDKWKKIFSDEQILKILKQNNQEPKIWFRVNTLKTSVKDIFDLLNKQNISFEQSNIIEPFFYTNSVQELLKSDIMVNGLISVQNPSNGLVVQLLNPQKDKVIFDGCSAPGGKMSYINEFTGGENEINSYDNDKKRIQIPINYIKKFNIKNVEYHNLDLSKDQIKPYDIGLIDVPCTGTGVLSKRVDLRWRRKPDDLKEMTLMQSSIINNVSKYIKDDGVLVYSSCSIEKEENWEIVYNFLNSNTDFKLDNADKFISKKYVDKNGCLSILPSYNGLDGVFAARLIKND
jgi:16S rRNA (cytosine967-C5)-methyltransferase